MPTRKKLMLFGVEHTETLCPSCRESRHFMRRETLMPVPKAPFAPLSHLPSMGHICFDCAAAEGLRATQPGALSWEMARIATGNDRQEKLRLPGLGAQYGLPAVRAAQDGDLERLHDWQDRTIPEDFTEE